MILENEMNKFPYIGENRHGVIMLILSRSKAVILSDVNKGKTHSIPDSKENPSTWFERKYKNITAEYLTNTYGKVESKEHAEFIKLIAGNEGIKCNYMVVSDDIKYFYFSGGVLFFTFSSINDDKFKLITIPLPPKEKSMESQKEWPAVGDEVLINLANHNAIYGHNIDGKKAVVRSIFKDGDTTVYAVSYEGACYCFVGGILKKPPTPEEELRAKLISVMDNSNTAFTYADFISKAIINGEIDGLEYKPQ